MSRVLCGTHSGYVRREDAVVMGSTETGSGAPLPVYACVDCVREHGLVPPARFVGHRATPPAVAGGAA